MTNEAPDRFLDTEVARVSLRNDELSLDDAWRHVNAPGCGGQVFFVGVVRADVTDTGAVEALEYEAYDGVAEREMAAIAAEAAARFGAERVVLDHRVGRLVPGDAAVIVGAGCGHRAEAFVACRYLIDELKRRVPIWKKEWTAGGGRWVACTHDHDHVEFGA